MNDAGFHNRISPRGLAWRLVLLVFIAVAGCAPRHGAQALLPVPAGETALRQIAIKVATTPARDAVTGAYTDARAPALNYESFTISIPPTHQATEIKLPKTTPDPMTSFAVTDRKALTNLSAAKGKGKQDVLIFVHVYNYTFAESLFRLAQVAADGELSETPIFFAWPSAASVVG